jgi:hypothetical protein
MSKQNKFFIFILFALFFCLFSLFRRLGLGFKRHVSETRLDGSSYHLFLTHFAKACIVMHHLLKSVVRGYCIVQLCQPQSIVKSSQGSWLMLVAVVFLIFCVFSVGVFDCIILFPIFNLLSPELLLILGHDI